jgi:ATP-dependent helicase/nuclease subunit A
VVRPASALTIDAATRKAQADASNPRASAWVSANAGSGKTHVLAYRVIRLLLAGSDPGRILCLTFTRAAAAEMAKRVFDILARWTAMPDNKLAAAIQEIEQRKPDADQIADARKLFARALETPGGLKIQTIHAFCERLLHQFPFEANVAGHFEVLDQRDAEALADRARRNVLARADRDDGVLGKALTDALGAASDFMVDRAMKEFIDGRDRLRRWLADYDSLEDALLDLQGRFGLDGHEDLDRLRAAIVGECPFAADFGRLVSMLDESGSKNNLEAADRLRPVLTAETTSAAATAYQAFWAKGDGGLRVASSLVSNAVKNAWPGLADLLEDERERLEALTERIRGAECFAATAAIIRLADRAIADYERMKVARGVLDFEDLIVKTVALLARPDAARWVHYKLDRGLDHILVDEAQDTSPRQWQVVKALAEEFFAGEGANDRVRTLFAVGDEKQSIFSFQGAVPAWFARMRRDLGDRARRAGFAWKEPALHLSFRSVPAVLAAVDAVFAHERAHRGLSSEPGPTTHTAARQNLPGRVVVWPMIEPPEKLEPPDWTSPVDHLGEKSPEVQLANRIADTVAGWLQREEQLESTGRPIRAGDILILSRMRGAQTDAINRALKSRGVPIAGADRIKLGEHIAVMDLAALGRVMLLPEDDLSLAAALKSPLLGLDEDQLFHLANRRGKETLWWRLGVAAVKEGGAYAEARARLDAWRARADQVDPHAFFAGVLGPDGGRARFLRRLGTEAEDVLDEFLAQALAFEESNTPTLEGFLAWLEAADTDVRRDTDSGRDEVRVMTVHGAKGLEAPIVFLIDNGSQPVHPNHDAKVVALAEDRTGDPAPLVWARSARSVPGVVRERIEALRGDAEDEYRRLLYVAITRACDRLYVCGTEKQVGDRDRKKRWHPMISAALEPDWAAGEDALGLPLYEWRPPGGIVVRAKGKQEAMRFAPRRPAWIAEPAPPPPPAVRRITPSSAASAAAAKAPARVPPIFAGSEALRAAERGRLVHRLLQSLPDFPEDARAERAGLFLAALAPAWPAEERAALVASVMTVLGHGDFAAVFAPGSRAEVEVAGRIGGAVLSGRIDRLAVSADRVLIVDYKTNRPAPQSLADAPHDYVMQLALYRAVLARLYPGRTVAAAILWTDRPALMEIPSVLLDLAEMEAVASLG